MSSNGLPHFARGEIVKGFGRGSKELGVPTANMPVDTVNKLPQELKPGVYYGWAMVDSGPVHKMVMSIGWNPFYKNKQKSMEVHIIHKFQEDFYGCMLSIIIIGFIRPEMDFTNVESLIKTIQNDIKVAQSELDKPENLSFQSSQFFKEQIKGKCKHSKVKT